jgi:hypothetical protein
VPPELWTLKCLQVRCNTHSSFSFSCRSTFDRLVLLC